MSLISEIKRRNQERTIALIHHDFDTAQERLLMEAKRLLETLEPQKVPNEGLAQRLTKAGFVNAAQVMEAAKVQETNKEIMRKRGVSEKQANLILHHKKAYPFHKFLTEEELDRICEKWQLIHAEVKHYKEAIPVKNLQDIENAPQLLPDDYLKASFKLKSSYAPQYKLDLTLREVGLNSECVTNEDAKRVCEKYYGRVVPEWCVVDKSTMWLWCYISYLENKEHELPNNTHVDSLLKSRGISNRARDSRTSSYEAFPISENSDTLYIAAPKSHFNLEGLEQVSKFGFRKIFKPEPKDPIVFRYVRGGIQVLTKWGLEASDPMLINAIDN